MDCEVSLSSSSPFKDLGKSVGYQNPVNLPVFSMSSVLLPPPVLCDRGIRRFQLEDEPSQPVTLEGLSDSGGPVRLRFKTIQLQSGSSQCTPLHAALPPARPSCLSLLYRGVFYI